MAEISPELVERMVVHMRAVAARVKVDPQMASNAFAAEAAAIAELLPVPVDPNLIEARRLAVDVCGAPGLSDWAGRVIDGREDSADRVRATLAGIKRGRELERQS